MKAFTHTFFFSFLIMGLDHSSGGKYKHILEFFFSETENKFKFREKPFIMQVVNCKNKFFSKRYKIK